MSEMDPHGQDEYTLTFSSNRLLLAICSLLLLMVLSVMLGIRIERFQQEQARVLAARAEGADAQTAEPAALAPSLPGPGATPAQAAMIAPVLPPPARPVAAPPKPAAKPVAAIRAEDLPDTVPPPTPILLAEANRGPSLTPPTPAPALAAHTLPRSAKFVVQVASSRDRAQANTRAKLLAGQGIPAFVESADLGKKGVWHRVLAGTYASKTEANAALAKLRTDPQFQTGFVRSY